MVNWLVLKNILLNMKIYKGKVFRLCEAVASKLDELEIRILYLEGLLTAKDKAA